VDEPRVLTAEEMQVRLGVKPPAKVQVILLYGVLYRPVDGGWEAYEEES
jgi:hypothetical protein